MKTPCVSTPNPVTPRSRSQRCHLYGLLAAGLILSASAARADSGIVNFHTGNCGTYQGLGAAGDNAANTVWNVFPASGATTPAAQASDGAATAVTLNVTYAFENGLCSPAATYQGSPCYILLNAAVATGGGGYFTFNNVPEGNYMLYIFAANYDGTRGTEITLDPVNGGGAHNGINYTVNTLKDDVCVPLVEGDNYILFTNVVPSSGVINGFYAPRFNPNFNTDGEAPLNGFQLVRQTDLTIFSQPPGAISVYAGYPVTLAVSAGGTGTLTYQWQIDGVDISGATSTNYSFTTTIATNTYRCRISNGADTIFTSPAVVSARAFVAPASGLIVNYHFFESWMGAYSGLAAYPDLPANTRWNGFPNNVGTPSGNGFASDGSATLINLAMTYVWDSGMNRTDYRDAHQPCYILTRNAYAQSTPGTFKLNNVPQGSYSLYIYAASYDGNRGTLIQLAATNGGSPHNGIFATTNTLSVASSCAPLVEGDNYVLFTNVVPDGVGGISGTFAPNFNPASGLDGEAPFNGFQLVRDPEPPTIVSQPAASTTVYVGNKAPLSFGVASSIPVAYQWYRGAGLVSGATNSTFAAAVSVDAYLCIAANVMGSVTSSVATVTSVPFVEPATGLVINYQNRYLPDYIGLGVYADMPTNTIWNKISDDPRGTTGFANSSDGSPTLTTLTMIYGWIAGENRDAYNGSPCFLLAKGNAVNGSSPGIGDSGHPTGAFTFNNVPPGKYTLYAYAANFDGTRGAAFSLATANGGTAHNGIFATTNSAGVKDSCVPLVEGDNYVMFTNVITDETGRISGTFVPNFNPIFNTDGEAMCNALQLVKTASLAPPTIAISLASPGQITVTWSGGVLVSAPSLNGPWNEVTGSSPLTLSATEPALYFRVLY